MARKLLLEPATEIEVEGPVQFIHQWIDMSKVGQHNWKAHGIPHMQAPVTLANGSTSHTCPPALGYSFAAGTTDGPGEFDFTQGVITGNPFWDFISGLLQEPSPEQVECQAPKPILLDTGEYVLPFAWHPIHIDTQVRKICSQPLPRCCG